MSEHLQGEEGMTDYQFKYLMELKDKCAEQERELEVLRVGNVSPDRIGISDFQYKATVEMIYQILKANFEVGKTPEEVLAIIAALKNAPKDYI